MQRSKFSILYACFMTAFCVYTVQDKVDQLKQEVRLQYQKMQQLLEEDLGKALNVLEKSWSKFCQENSRQVLQLNERRQEAKKMLSSVQVLFDKAENINFMKVRHLSFLSLNPHLLFFFICLSCLLCAVNLPRRRQRPHAHIHSHKCSVNVAIPVRNTSVQCLCLNISFQIFPCSQK